jgi:hypothetical protein
VKKILVLILGLLVVNSIGADILLFRLWQKTDETITPIVETKYISPSIVPTLFSPSPSPSPKITSITTPDKKSRNTTIIPIPGTASTDKNFWQDLNGTEFNLNTADYPNLKEAYLEVNFKLFNGNGIAFVRLFDITAGIEVWGSEVKTSSQTFTAVSSEKLTLREGNHLYRIQAKSLTADTVVYNSGRIKIIVEN